MKSKLPLSLIGSAVFAALCNQGFAQSADLSADGNITSLEESLVIAEDSTSVTAIKTGTPIIDIPRSLSVFTKEEIEQQGITSIGQLVDYTPGVSNSQGEGHRDAVVFRGVRSTADFFIDGIRDDVQYYRSLYNIEQVEILRGPSALFFGRGGVGGVINRVTKKPDFSGDYDGFETSVDSFGGFAASFDYNKVLGDDTAFRLNTSYESLENHRDFYYGDRIGLNPVITHQLSDSTSLTFSFEHINHERFIDRGIPTGSNGEPVAGLGHVVFGDSELNFHTLEANIAKIVLNHEINDNWRASTSASYGTYDKLYQNFYASGYDQATDIVTIDGYLDTTQRDRFQWAGDIVGEFYTGEVRHKLALGAEFIHTSNDNDRYNAVFTPDENADSDTEDFIASNFRLRGGVGTNANGTTVVNNFNTDLADDTQATVKTYSFFLQDEIALTNWLDVIVGARFDSFDIEVEGTSTGNESDTHVSPRLGLVVKPTQQVSLYASYGETFLPSAGEQYANAGDRFEPDTFENLELGVKWNIKDNLLLSLAAFQTDQSFTTDIDGDGLQDRQDSEISGIEAQLKGRLSDNWSISAGYTYLDAETTGGVTPRDTPENSFSIWNSYQATDHLTLGFGATYQDETLTGNGSTSKLPSYIRVDAAAAYRFSNDLSIQLNIENLFDTDYYPTSHSTHQASVGAPINASLTVRKSF